MVAASGLKTLPNEHRFSISVSDWYTGISCLYVRILDICLWFKANIWRSSPDPAASFLHTGSLRETGVLKKIALLEKKKAWPWFCQCGSLYFLKIYSDSCQKLWNFSSDNKKQLAKCEQLKPLSLHTTDLNIPVFNFISKTECKSWFLLFFCIPVKLKLCCLRLILQGAEIQ